MKIRKVFENTPIPLDESYLETAKQLIDDHPHLPFHLRDSTIYFDQYTVGELVLDDLSISILPRTTSLTLRHFFEMLAFIDNNSFIAELEGYGYDYRKASFNVVDVAKYFSRICSKLLQYGLTGNFVEQECFSKKIKGRIDFAKFNPTLIPEQGVSLIYDEYILDIPANRLIKSALLKLLKLDPKNVLSTNVSQILREFEQVDEFRGDLALLDEISSSHFSANPYYSISIEYAIRILRDLKLDFQNGKLTSYAFLINSNSIFEQYARKVLCEELSEKVSKWNSPKPWAVLEFSGQRGVKGYIPDILIDYNESLQSCTAVFDAKNKEYAPDKGNLSDLVSPADLYQLIFYCRQLNCKIGGLVFPSDKSYEPVRLTADVEKDLHIFLLSLDMSLPPRERHAKFVEAIKNQTLIYC